MLAGLARARMKAKHAALVEALTGRFDEHHAELARKLLDQIDGLTTQIEMLTARIDQLIAAVPAAAAPTAPTGPATSTGEGEGEGTGNGAGQAKRGAQDASGGGEQDARVLSALERRGGH
ncbi:MAG TPA: hypothetical protein VGQ24_11335 [Gemmatimonadales bacterium]|jgi:hypothetical protein|nr:hypothetical protein [Gemmatimonadales bacterium]